MRGRERPLHLLFLAALGVMGWTLLLVTRSGRGPLAGGAASASQVPLVLFFVVIAGARLMAFPLIGDTVVSLDSAFYIAATACLGTLRAGWLVALALTVDAVWRVAREATAADLPTRVYTPGLPPAREAPTGEQGAGAVGAPVAGGSAAHAPAPGPSGRSAGSASGREGGARPPLDADEPTWARHLARVLYVVYFGGMSGALVLIGARLFHIDATVAGAHFPLQPDADIARDLLWRIPAVGGFFLLAHYLLQGARLWIAGFDAGPVLRGLGVRGALAEASLLPLAVAIVLIYDPRSQLAFELLGATYLVINYVFNRRSAADRKLRRRVAELETLNRMSRSLSGTLQLHELLEILARETVQSVPEAQIFAVSLWDDKQAQFVVDVFHRDRGNFTRLSVPRGEGVSWWVVENREPLLIRDLRKARDRHNFGEISDGGDPAIRSWLGVPLVMYDQVMGVLSVQSEERDAFSLDHQRLLGAIGAQAAAAIQNARLYELATVDGLTGLYVRRYFDSRLREEWKRSQRFEGQFALIILDIDDFKQVNDRHGHQVGDRVLREVAQVIKRNMRGVDIAARYGGEEFAFILPRTGLVDGHAVAERIRADLADHRVALEDGPALRVTASLGVSAYPESRVPDAGALLYRADVALYRAKAAGKNRVEIYWPVEETTEENPAKDAKAEGAVGARAAEG